MKKYWQKTPTWIIFTAFFLVLTMVLVSCLYLNGRSMIWVYDGIAQHYPILVNLRSMLINFLTHCYEGFTHWSWNMGLGADQLTGLSYYVIGDFFNYLIVLFPQNAIESAFAFLIFLRMWVSGLAFLLFLSSYRFKKISRVVGALAYTFNGYALSQGMHHPFFILPLIFFPLICYGIDHGLLNKSWLPLIFAVFLTFVGNFYFAWIVGIGAIFYTIIRFYSLKKRPHFRFWKNFIKLSASVLVGLMMSAVVLLPTLLFAMKSTRVPQGFASGLIFFPAQYYLSLADPILETGNSMNFWLVIGITSIALLGLVYIVRNHKRFLLENVSLIVIFIGILIPAFGAIMNTFTTPSNRWILLGNLLFALAATIFIDNIENFTKKDINWFVIFSIAFVGFIWVGHGFLLNLSAHDFIDYCFLFLTVIILLLIFMSNISLQKKQFALTTVFILNLATNIIGVYSPNQSYMVTQQLYSGLASRFQKDYYDGADKYIQKQTGFFRTSQAPSYHYNPEIQNDPNYTNSNTNTAMNIGTKDTSIYLTLQNGYVGDFAQAVGNSQFTFNTPIAQNDYRTGLNDLLGVKYIFAKANTSKSPQLPYGYKIVKGKNGKPLIFNSQSRVNVSPMENLYGTAIYKTSQALPLAYTQNQTQSPASFNKLDAVDKERAMIDAAQVNNSTENIHPSTYISPKHTLAYSVMIDPSNLIIDTNTLAAYRLGVLGSPNASKDLKQPHKQLSLNANKKATSKFLQTNKNIYQTNQSQNANGLKEMTSDAAGNKYVYSLNINKPNLTKNSELFLVLSGIKQNPRSLKDHMNWVKNSNLLDNSFYSRLNKIDTYRSGILKPSFGGYNFDVYAGGYHTGFAQYDDNNLSNYRQIDNMVLNLGYSTNARKTVTLKFDTVKGITFSSVKLISIPFNKQYDNQITHLQQNGLKSLTVNDDNVSGNYNSPSKTTLVTSIPYSKGWQLKIDGNSIKTFPVNKGFVGATIPGGSHHVALHYQTPGLKASFVGSLLGWLLFIGFGIEQFIINRRKKQNNRQTKK